MKQLLIACLLGSLTFTVQAGNEHSGRCENADRGCAPKARPRRVLHCREVPCQSTPAPPNDRSAVTHKMELARTPIPSPLSAQLMLASLLIDCGPKQAGLWRN